jgi:hypothetical protein
MSYYNKQKLFDLELLLSDGNFYVVSVYNTNYDGSLGSSVSYSFNLYQKINGENEIIDLDVTGEMVFEDDDCIYNEDEAKIKILLDLQKSPFFGKYFAGRSDEYWLFAYKFSKEIYHIAMKKSTELFSPHLV